MINVHVGFVMLKLYMLSMYYKLGILTEHYRIFFCIFRTLSNWTMEFDRWAPSVVKIAYKVSIGVYVCVHVY